MFICNAGSGLTSAGNFGPIPGFGWLFFGFCKLFFGFLTTRVQLNVVLAG
jgi:hypothetical protein